MHDDHDDALQGKLGEGKAESRAGYELLSKVPKPPAVWMRLARQDLAAAERALGRDEEAARFESELAAADAEPKR